MLLQFDKGHYRAQKQEQEKEILPEKKYAAKRSFYVVFVEFVDDLKLTLSSFIINILEITQLDQLISFAIAEIVTSWVVNVTTGHLGNSSNS